MCVGTDERKSAKQMFFEDLNTSPSLFLNLHLVGGGEKAEVQYKEAPVRSLDRAEPRS
jgi:hypothetical protein